MKEEDFDSTYFKQIHLKRESKRKIHQILKLYVFLGMSVFIFSMAYVAIIELDISFLSENRLIAIAGLFGLILSLMSFSLMAIKNIKKGELYEDEVVLVLFLREWVNFERNLDIFLERRGIKTRKGAIIQNLEEVRNLGIFDEVDSITGNLALRIRNQFVHEGDFLDLEKIELVIRSLQGLSKKLQTKQTSFEAL